jgi:hypothetical protein
MSARRATPMPRGSRPAMAAFTRSGARKASEIVMLTFRMLHRSRLAMLSLLTELLLRRADRFPRARLCLAKLRRRKSPALPPACRDGNHARVRLADDAFFAMALEFLCHPAKGDGDAQFNLPARRSLNGHLKKSGPAECLGAANGSARQELKRGPACERPSARNTRYRQLLRTSRRFSRRGRHHDADRPRPIVLP